VLVDGSLNQSQKWPQVYGVNHDARVHPRGAAIKVLPKVKQRFVAVVTNLKLVGVPAFNHCLNVILHTLSVCMAMTKPCSVDQILNL
jgi:hypothetical protein